MANFKSFAPTPEQRAKIDAVLDKVAEARAALAEADSALVALILLGDDDSLHAADVLSARLETARMAAGSVPCPYRSDWSGTTIHPDGTEEPHWTLSWDTFAR